MMMYSFSQRSLDNLEFVNTKLIDVARLALKESKVDFSVIDGYRSEERQKALYEAGKSEADGVINKSAHQSGKAIDVIPYVKGLDIWDTNNGEVAKAWIELYRAFMRASRILDVNIEFGLGYNIGNGYDYPHIQLKG